MENGKWKMKNLKRLNNLFKSQKIKPYPIPMKKITKGIR